MKRIKHILEVLKCMYEIGEKNMAIKRVKLDYMSAVSETPPVGKITIPSSHIEELDRAIRQKVRQNEAERAASMEAASRYIVR